MRRRSLRSAWVARRLAAAAILAAAVASPSRRAVADEPRPVPDYDGRPEEPPSVGEVLIWIPRLILFPAYLVTEWVVRRPIAAVAGWTEQRLPAFGATGKFGVLPTALFDFGLRPNVGVYAFLDPFLHPDNRFRVSAAFGGLDWLSVAAKERFILADDDGGEIVLRGGYLQRPDVPFYGIGPDARQIDETFYRWQRWEAATSIELRRDHVGFSSEVLYTQGEREDSDYGKPTGRLFPSRYFLDAGVGDWDDGGILELRLTSYLDSRGRGPTFRGSGTGARVELRGGLGCDPADVERQTWLRVGGAASVFLDLTGTRRVLGLNVSADMVDLLGDGPVPASALVGLGGNQTMSAFYDGRFRGQSAVTTTLQYRWPIASFLDAELFASLGNAFGARFEDLDLEKLAGSGGLAIRTNTSRDLSFDVLIATGTRQFDRGPLTLESLRFALGTNRAF